MQTQLPLHSIGPVIHGYHENPFEILGPHEIEQNGRRALAVRAYLPEAQRAWVVDSAHGACPPDAAHPPRRPVRSGRARNEDEERER